MPEKDQTLFDAVNTRRTDLARRSRQEARRDGVRMRFRRRSITAAAFAAVLLALGLLDLMSMPLSVCLIIAVALLHALRTGAYLQEVSTWRS